jgi:hypothetical protein
MKSLFAATALLWLTLTLELAWPDRVPRASLLIPAAGVVVLWCRSAAGLWLAGLALLVDWIARPTVLPLLPMLLPPLACAVLLPTDDSGSFRSSRRRVPQALQLPLITLLGLCLHLAGTCPIAIPPDWSVPGRDLAAHLKSLLIVALPLSGLATLAVRFADEFGLRRTFETPS